MPLTTFILDDLLSHVTKRLISLARWQLKEGHSLTLESLCTFNEKLLDTELACFSTHSVLLESVSSHLLWVVFFTIIVGLLILKSYIGPTYSIEYILFM